MPPDAFRLQLVGGPGAEFNTRQAVAGHGLTDVVEFVPAVSHGQSLGYLRAADILARYGGEEFMVVLASAPADYAVTVAERLRLTLSQNPVMLGTPVQQDHGLSGPVEPGASPRDVG